jgi:hypothetical protein
LVLPAGQARHPGQVGGRGLGLAYLALWTVMLGSRILFAYAASDWDRAAIARFFASHQLTGSAVTPAFVLMTIASLVVVALGTALRVRSLPGGQGPNEDAGLLPEPTTADT